MTLDSKIEAILFLLGEPVQISYLANIADCPEGDIRDALIILSEKLQGRGVALVQKDDRVMLSTAGEACDILEKLVKDEYDKNLTKPMLETLAIVLYKGPITRQEIDYIRGVNSSFTLRNLLVRDFVEREEKNSGAYLYRPSFKLLQYLGVKRLSELPDYDAFRERIDDFLKGEADAI
jgi:segregation and condensation protein B